MDHFRTFSSPVARELVGTFFAFNGPVAEKFKGTLHTFNSTVARELVRPFTSLILGHWLVGNAPKVFFIISIHIVPRVERIN